MRKVRFYENERLDIVDAKRLQEFPYKYVQQTSHALGLGYANGMIPDVIHVGQSRHVPNTQKTQVYDPATCTFSEEGADSVPQFSPSVNFQSEDRRPTVNNAKWRTNSSFTVGGRFYMYRSFQGMWKQDDIFPDGVPETDFQSGGTGVLTLFDSLDPHATTTFTDGVEEMFNAIYSVALAETEDSSRRAKASEHAKNFSIWGRRTEIGTHEESRRLWSHGDQDEVLFTAPTVTEGQIEFSVAPLLDSAGDMRSAGWVRLFDCTGMYADPYPGTVKYATGPIWRPVLAFDYWRQWAGNAKNVSMNVATNHASRASFPYATGYLASGGTANSVTSYTPFEPIVGNIHNRFSHLQIPTVKNSDSVSGYYRWLTAINDTVKVKQLTKYTSSIDLPSIAEGGIGGVGTYLNEESEVTHKFASNLCKDERSNYVTIIGAELGVTGVTHRYQFDPGICDPNDYGTYDSFLGRNADVGFVGSHVSAQSELFDSNGQPGRAFDLYDCLMNSDDPIFGQNCTSLGELVFRLARAVSQLRSGTDLDPYLFRRTYEFSKDLQDDGKRLGKISNDLDDMAFGTGTCPGNNSWFSQIADLTGSLDRSGARAVAKQNTDTVRPLAHLEEFYSNYAFAHPHILYQGTMYWSRTATRRFNEPLNGDGTGRHKPDWQRQPRNNASHVSGDPNNRGPGWLEGWLPVGKLYNPHRCAMSEGGGSAAYRALAPRRASDYREGTSTAEGTGNGADLDYAVGPIYIALPNEGDAAGLKTMTAAGVKGYQRTSMNGYGWDSAIEGKNGGYDFCLMVPAQFQITSVIATAVSSWRAYTDHEEQGDQQGEWERHYDYQAVGTNVHYDNTLYRLEGGDNKLMGTPGGDSTIHKRILVHVHKLNFENITPSHDATSNDDAKDYPNNFNITVYGNYYNHTADNVFRNASTELSHLDRTQTRANSSANAHHAHQLWATPRSLTRVSAFDQPMSGYGDALAYSNTSNQESASYNGGPVVYGYQYNRFMGDEATQAANAAGAAFGVNTGPEQRHPEPTTNVGQDALIKALGYLSVWAPSIGAGVKNSMHYLPIDLGPDPNPYYDAVGTGPGGTGPFVPAGPLEDPYPMYDFYNDLSGTIGQGF